MASTPEVLTQVPPQLQKLVRLVVRAFYQPEHYIVMDILARYPCVSEGDLVELLKLEQKRLRVVLLQLKRDKLLKSVQRMESKELDNGEKRSYLCHYYYINYKVFVNVVKYKLDRMRERIQAEERTVSNRTSYNCPNCENTYSDLDVDRLIDPVEGVLKCFMCNTILTEDRQEGSDIIDVRSMLSRLNEQLKPILEILREVDNISLAEHILEPEPQSIRNLIQENKYDKNKSQQQGKGNWATSRVDDIYGDQTISINIGTEEELRKKATQKDAPQWMKESTVYESSATKPVTEKIEKGATASMTAPKTVLPGDEIMELLSHEEYSNITKETTSSSSSDNDSTSDEDDEIQQANRGYHQQPPQDIAIDEAGSTISSNGEEDSEDDEMTIRVGDKVYELNEITQDIISTMTPEEKEKYTQLCQQAYNNFY